MSLTIPFNISDRDLAHFKDIMHTAFESAKDLAPEEILRKARESTDMMEQAELPDFVQEKMESLKSLIDAVEDEEWQVPDDERREILTSLAYFTEPHDLVPDSIPVLGYIDDAIMIELVLQDMSLDLEAYNNFCTFRSAEEAKRGEQAFVNRESWLAHKRQELRTNLRRQRNERIRRRLFGGFM